MTTTPNSSPANSLKNSQRLVAWLFCGKTLRRGLIGLIGLITLIAVFYTVENWRGNRAWESCRRYLVAHNLPTDWTPPKPLDIPADQNFTQTPLLKAIGIRGKVDTNVSNHLQAWERGGTSRHLGGGMSRHLGASGKMTDLAACQKELRALPDVTLPPLPRNPALDVLDFLRVVETEMNELRQASLRPHAAFILQGNDPIALDIPNFVAARQIAQLFSIQTIAELALGKPDEAYHDQWVVYRLAEAMQSSDTLVATMIRVALLGLNTQTFWEGWARRQWTESEWLKFQAQYHEVDLLADLDRSMRLGEMAAINHLLNRLSIAELAKALDPNSLPRQSDPTRWLIGLAPRGWIRQNQVVYNQLMTAMVDSWDVASQRVFPGKQAEHQRQLETTLKKGTPCNLIARITIPNFMKASQNVARKQTWAKQAELVCAMERYRLKNGNYPESIQALVPDFIAKLPTDLITGEPFKYRRQADGQFLLYSVGWNEKDDGGEIAFNSTGQWNDDQGDWVWPARP